MIATRALQKRWLIVGMALAMVMTVLATSVDATGHQDRDGVTGIDCDKEPERCRPEPPPSKCDLYPDDPRCAPDCDPTVEDCKEPPPPPTNQEPEIDGCEAIDPFDLDALESTTEVGSDVGTVLATDPDGDLLTFSGNDVDGFFTVGDDGTVSVAEAIPALDGEPYVVQVDVTVSDAESSVTGTCEITVEPVVVLGSQVLRIYASTPVGTVLNAALGDRVYTQTLSDPFFGFDAATNEVSVATEFPRPETGTEGDDRNVTYLMAFDGSTVSEISTFTLTVLVVDFFDDDNPGVYDDAAIYEDAINWLADPAVANRISPVTNGCGVLLFCPDDPTTRGHFAVFVMRIWELLDESDPLPDNPFADTDGHRFERWITELYNTGITSGCGTDADGNLIYCPEDGVEWGEFAIMVHRAYVGYTDTSETELTTQEGALAWLTDEGFTTGVLAADLCSTADCKDDEIKRGATALVLRNIWDMTALGDD